MKTRGLVCRLVALGCRSSIRAVRTSISPESHQRLRPSADCFELGSRHSWSSANCFTSHHGLWPTISCLCPSPVFRVQNKRDAVNLFAEWSISAFGRLVRDCSSRSVGVSSCRLFLRRKIGLWPLGANHSFQVVVISLVFVTLVTRGCGPLPPLGYADLPNGFVVGLPPPSPSKSRYRYAKKQHCCAICLLWETKAALLSNPSLFGSFGQIIGLMWNSAWNQCTLCWPQRP